MSGIINQLVDDTSVSEGIKGLEKSFLGSTRDKPMIPLAFRTDDTCY
jgi:hypothetical protein